MNPLGDARTTHAGVPTTDTILRGGTILTLADRPAAASALAIYAGRIVAVGDDASVSALAGTGTTVVELNGRTVMPGLIDAHAHLDREGLKGLLPSLAGCESVSALVERLRRIAGSTPIGSWIVTMPLGYPPEYQWSESMFKEGRLPDRHDLDLASRDHPLLIRSAWGHWPGRLPLVSIANSLALELAGVRRHSASPSPRLRIERDAAGEPSGRFFEDTLQPLAEFTLFRTAPHFTADDRARTLSASMAAYNAVGTTGIFEGHGVAAEVIDAYRGAQARGQMTVRARLVLSPGWSGASAAEVVNWVHREAPRLRDRGGAWLRLAGLYAEEEAEPGDARLRALCSPRTGWAGFSYDTGLSSAALNRLLEAAASERLQVCGIQSGMANRFIAVGEKTPIDGLRWVVAHPATLDSRQIAGLAAHGIGVTTLTGGHIWRRGSALLARIGPEHEATICPIRALLDAGVPTALATDNVPISLWPSIWQAVERIDRDSGRAIAPAQRIGREEALRCATVHGAWICGDEDTRGTIEPGKQADLIVLPANPLTMAADRLPLLKPDCTLVDGKIVSSAAGTETG